ncbi:MAG: WYL domain-containing protein [Acidaminococcus sp.]|uniref:WYL domain-containing protein n=1 Tax=Acidaminococcus sp. TaxID=1872103 RepID=UPI003F15AC49
MLFHEIYGRYYQVLERVLREACRRPLDRETLLRLIRQGSFGDSLLELPGLLQESRLLNGEGKTPLASVPQRPLTLLERRWLAAIWQDPRVQLFDPPRPDFALDEPLFPADFFVVYDRYGDGDPFTEPVYRTHFRQLLQALRENRSLRVRYRGRKGLQELVVHPDGLEYSGLDDKFRFLAHSRRGTPYTLRVSSLVEVELEAPGTGVLERPPRWKERAVLELVDERKALERALLHFSDLEKETVQLDETHYQLILHYYKQDETELLIRILAFGPFLKVKEPAGLVKQLRERVLKQKSCER